MAGKTLTGPKPQCGVIAPDGTSTAHDLAPRWSDANVELPAAVVRPQTEDDIVAAIQLARVNNLVVLAAGGGHAPFVPVGAGTLYLDLRHFKAVDLDKTSGTVRLGGGVTTGELTDSLTDQGYYTTAPDVNAVGVVGAVLGGGSSVLNGLHGMMIDQIVAMRVVTADGQVRDLSAASSSDEEKALFNTLCGAGHGLAVVTALTMRAYPLSSLGLTDGKVWRRHLIFPGAAVDVAAAAFARLFPAHPKLGPSLVCMRAPPTAPNPGAPLISLSAVFYGSAEEAEGAAAPLLDPEVVKRAVLAETRPLAFQHLGDDLNPLAAHGGHKEIRSGLLAGIDAPTIVEAYRRWERIAAEVPGAARSAMVVFGWDTAKLLSNGRAEENAAKFFDLVSRGRPVTGLLLRWCNSRADWDATASLGDELLGIFRARERDAEVRGLANNMIRDVQPELHFGKEQIAELRRVKRVWDADGVFYCPYPRE